MAVSDAEAAFRIAPQLATAVIEQLTTAGRSRRAIREVGEDQPIAASVEAPAAAAPVVEAARAEQPDAPRGRVALPTPAFDDKVFFNEDVACPICGTTFEYLRVRLGAVRPTGRDSDFRTRYRGTDPTLYTITVCPHCWYAAYAEEFGDASESERRLLQEGAARRAHPDRSSLTGVRSLDDAAESFDLALECYETRSGGHRRRAGLLHRRAWLERARGDDAREREYLGLAADAYRSAYEADKTITDTSATRAAYLIGDLYLRLGDLPRAGRWLDICLAGKHDAQSGILRMARERMHECRMLLEQRGAA